MTVSKPVLTYYYYYNTKYYDVSKHCTVAMSIRLARECRVCAVSVPQRASYSTVRNLVGSNAQVGYRILSDGAVHVI